MHFTGLRGLRQIALITVFFTGIAKPIMAQVLRSGDVALTYQAVHTNAPPGECGCFWLNGAGLSGSLNLVQHVSLAAEVSVGHSGNALSTGESLTLTSFLAGARYHLPHPWMGERYVPEPFAQVLVGGEHAGGGIAGVADGHLALATRIGGGIDLPVRSGFAIRVLQADYFLTRSANSISDIQRNLSLGAGVAYHWSR